MNVPGWFVGRQAELEVLDARLSAARTGRAQIVYVEGSAGSGKSTLLTRFIAGLGDARVLEVSGEEGETFLPYGLVDQLGPSAATGPSSDPLVVGAALVELFVRAQADERVAVIVIDDLHWSDRPSCRALLFAIRRLRNERVLVVVSGRPNTFVDEGWARFISGDGRVTRVRLSGLTVEEVGALAITLGMSGLSERAASNLVAHTAGNVLYCRALLEELDLETLNGSAADGLAAPRELSALVMARVAALPAGAQDFLAAAAVLGRHADVGAAESVAGASGGGSDLDAAVAAGLVTRTGAGLEVSFAHPLYRTAVYADLSPTRRRMLHARAAMHTTGRPSLAHRVAASDGPDDALASVLDLEGRTAAEIGDGTGASWAFEQSARMSSGTADRERRLLDAAGVALNAADVGTARRVLESAESSSARRDALLGLLSVYTGSPAAETLLRRAWAQHDPTEPDVGARAATSLSNWLVMSGRCDEAVEWAEVAVNATRVGSALWMMARTAHASALASAGRAHDGLAVLSFLDADAGRVPLAATDPLILRGMMKLFTDDLAGATADLSVATSRIRSGVPSSYPSPCLVSLSEAHFRRGAWDAAAAIADLAVLSAHDSDRPLDLARGHAQAVMVTAARGEWQEAQEHVAAARAAAERLPLTLAVAAAAVAGAALATARGDPVGVLAATDPLHVAGRLEVGGLPALHPWRASEVDALIGLGRLQDAAAALDAFAAAIPAAGSASAESALSRCRGNLGVASGSTEGVADAFSRARALGQSAAVPFESALLDLDDARRLHAQGDLAAARTACERARTAYSALKATPYVGMCDAELAGIEATERADPAIAALSSAERSVARLVAAGRTNREVAAALYLSPKTVEYHLHNIYLKLQITSRRALPPALR